MGLLDKIIDGIKSELKSGLSDLLDPKQNDEETQVSAPAAASVQHTASAPVVGIDDEPDYAKVYDTDESYFAEIITDEEFEDYTIERSVHPGELDGSAHPSCLPISYLFSRDGEAELAVLIMNSNQRRAMIANGTYRVLDEKRIPYIRFYKGMKNERTYVLDRIRDNL